MNSATANPTGEYQALILGHLQKHRGAVQKSVFRWAVRFTLISFCCFTTPLCFVGPGLLTSSPAYCSARDGAHPGRADSRLEFSGRSVSVGASILRESTKVSNGCQLVTLSFEHLTVSYS
jgi:hypothetical protein